MYIGDNPIARKLRLHLLQPSHIPGTRAGTVQLPCDAHQPVCTTLLARGTPRQDGHRSSYRSDQASQRPSQKPGEDISAHNVVLKISRNMACKPTLANSISKSILSVKRATADPFPSTWEAGNDASERLLRVFDALQCELGQWQQMECVPEETPSLTQKATLAQAGDVTIANQERVVRTDHPTPPHNVMVV